MGKPKPEPGDIAVAGMPNSDGWAALELAATLVEDNRLTFARSFSLTAVLSYCEALGVGEPTSIPAESCAGVSPLPREAYHAARRIGAGVKGVPLAEAAYAIGSLYTALLPEAFRARLGIFYTPPGLVERLLDMAEEAGIDWKTARILDPACGGGAFLIGVAARMASALQDAEPAIILQNVAARVRGFDVDPCGAWLAQAMLAIALQPIASAAGREVPQIVETRDSLELRPEEAEAWDLVIGNPPYGRITPPPERRKRFARSIYGHANVYAMFTEAAVYWLKRGGVVGYVTPTSMLSGLYYKALRALLLAEAPPLSINLVTERDGVFADVLQETMLATYRKGGLRIGSEVGFVRAAGNERGHGIISRKAGSFTLPERPHSPWLLPRAAEQAALARRLRSMAYRLADYGYGVSTGPLVWNRHKDQFCEKPVEGAFPVIWAESVTADRRFTWRSEKRNHAPWFAARRPKDDWLIVTKPCVLLQRTTAKEQARRLIAAELPESFIRSHRGVVIENHLNMVRAVDPNPEVPTSVIAALLNSGTVDAAFRCINGSVAVSAFELEEMPLPPPAVMANLARLVGAGAPREKIEAVVAAAYGRSDAAAAS